jgi:hypothetical protein
VHQEPAKFTSWSWEATGALGCFAGGIAAGIAGSILTAIAWILGTGHPWLRAVGTAFLVVTIPLLILAGYCLDWMEDKSKNPLHKT